MPPTEYNPNNAGEFEAIKVPEKPKGPEKQGPDYAKLEQLKVEVGAYAALVSKVLGETTSLPILAADKTQLEVYKADLLAEVEQLEHRVEALTTNLQLIDKSTLAGDPLWRQTIVAIAEASTSFSKILTDGEAALALEQKVREDLGRA